MWTPHVGPALQKGLLHKSQLSRYILLGVFGKPVFLPSGSRISIWIMVEPRVESPEQNWSYPGPPSEIRGVVAGAPYSGKPMVNMPKTLIHSDTVKRRFGLSYNCSFSFCMLIVVWCSKLVARQCLNFGKRDSRHINHVVFIRFISDVVWHHFGGDQSGGTIHIAADKSHTHLPSSSTECKCQNSFFAVNLF